MKAAIYDPYLDTLGGGERYCATVAEALQGLGYTVDFWWKDNFENELNDRFALNLSQTNFINFDPLKKTLLEKIKFTGQYDLIFWVSDGSIPVSFAKKTLIHMQVPTHWKGCGTLGNRIKSKFYPFVCNSVFTKNVIDKVYKVNSQVLYPPVEVEKFVATNKKDLIVSVGRFNKLLNAKRQDVLIEAFSKLGKAAKNWQLVLAGGAADDEYLNDLTAQSGNLNISILPNPSFAQIKSLFGQAKFFWSATGFDINPKLFPEKMEHFGITTVEAMAAGCVPLVTNCGGHIETVTEGKTGYLWDTVDELTQKTSDLIKNKELWQTMSEASQVRSKSFSKEIFCTNLKGLL